MKTLISLLLSLLSAPLLAASLLASEDFEGAGWASSFQAGGWGTGSTVAQRVTNNPHSGTYSGRLNFTQTDGIHGGASEENPHFQFRGGYDWTALNELFFRGWFRWDDFTPAPPEDYPGSGEGKFMWMYDSICTTASQGMYANNLWMNPAYSTVLRLSYGNGCWALDWSDTQSAAVGRCDVSGGCWGFSSLNMAAAGQSPSTTGTWNKFEIYFNLQQCYLKMWMNDVIMKSSKHGDGTYGAAGLGTLLADGTTYYDLPESAGGCEIGDTGRNLSFEGAAMLGWASGAGAHDNCVDGDGYCMGWQVDDLELWSGNPTPGVFLGRQAP